MQSSDYSYLILLLPAIVLFWALPVRFRRVYVFAVGLCFYASWNLSYTILPVGIALVVYLCAERMNESKAKPNGYLWAGVSICVLLLAWFKYRGFLIGNLDTLLQHMGLQRTATAAAGAVLPLGISFYAFNAIGCLIDTSQRRVRNLRFSDLSIFLSFWPQLLAGPIVRIREIVPQLTFNKPFQTAFVWRGLDRLIVGLVQKNVLANSLAPWVDEGFLPKAAAVNSALDNWFLAVALGLQIYFDFAAYSNLAIGTAQLLGVNLPENFRFPYHAKNPSDFWSRWHMTLSRWVRDYLFFPVNARFQGRSAVLYPSLLGIMALVGLWHGAGWGFVLWGLMQGSLLVAYRMWETVQQARFPKLADSRTASILVRLVTLAGVFAAWIPFRCNSLSQASTMLHSMFLPSRFEVSYSVNFYLVTAIVGAFCLIEPYMAEAIARPIPRLSGAGAWMRPLVYATGLAMFMIFDDQNTQFIYFQF